jgi:hypothetical protein
MSPYEDWTPTSRWWTPSPNKRSNFGGRGARRANRWFVAQRPGRRCNARTSSGYGKPTKGEPALKPTACSQAVARGPIMGSGPYLLLAYLRLVVVLLFLLLLLIFLVFHIFHADTRDGPEHQPQGGQKDRDPAPHFPPFSRCLRTMQPA